MATIDDPVPDGLILNENPTQFASVVNLNAFESRKLHELQAMDALSEELATPNDWDCMEILDHKVHTHDMQDVHVKVKAPWHNGDTSWV